MPFLLRKSKIQRVTRRKKELRRNSLKFKSILLTSKVMFKSRSQSVSQSREESSLERTSIHHHTYNKLRRWRHRGWQVKKPSKNISKAVTNRTSQRTYIHAMCEHVTMSDNCHLSSLRNLPCQCSRYQLEISYYIFFQHLYQRMNGFRCGWRFRNGRKRGDPQLSSSEQMRSGGKNEARLRLSEARKKKVIAADRNKKRRSFSRKQEVVRPKVSRFPCRLHSARSKASRRNWDLLMTTKRGVTC